MANFAYRSDLTRRELLPALGAGAGAGLAVAYLVQLLLRKRSLPERPPRAGGARG